MRSESGVLVVSLFTAAYPIYTDQTTGKKKKARFSCKYDCHMCPNEPAHKGNNFVAQPRSYLTQEPGVLRANECGFDCVKQFRTRINQYLCCGHTIDKIEIIVLGGTVSSYPKDYIVEFCRDIYYSANTQFDTRYQRYTLEQEIKINETSNVRIIGLTLETRPDCINLEELMFFRRLGVTRVQIGVQHTDNRILKKINRGHTIEDSYKAIQLLKDNCFKVDIHIMPLLPDASPEDDEKMLNEVLTNPQLQVDQIKIYPTSVVPWTKIEKWYNEGTYKPYSQDILFNLIVDFMEKVHPWIRLNRIVRDITSNYISGGCNTPHMRQLLQKYFKNNDLFCYDIRSREVKDKYIEPGNIQLTVYEYPSSGGTEYFLSYTSLDQKVLYAFLRLRLPNKKNIFNENGKRQVQSVLEKCALIRELHTYGKLQKVGQKNNFNYSQHYGFGKLLLEKAEIIAYINGFNTLSCISGVGVREYYQKRGFKQIGNEMQKNISLNTKIYIYWNKYSNLLLILFLIVCIFIFSYIQKIHLNI